MTTPVKLAVFQPPGGGEGGRPSDGLPDALIAAYERPWNEPSKPITSTRSGLPFAV